MSERVAVAAFALVTLLALWVAPWAAFSRETGSRAAVILLPDRVIDFTGRTDPLSVPGQGAVLWLSVAGLAVVAGAAALPGRARHGAWLAAGALLIGTATWGLAQFDAAVEARRAVAFQEAIAPNIADPRPNQDAERLRQLSEEALTRPVTVSVELAREAGVVVRRLPYGGSAPGFAAFLTLVAGAAALLFGLRVWPRAGRVLDRMLTAVAIPAVSITLALLAAAIVILLLQPTPLGRDVVISGPLMALAGRI